MTRSSKINLACFLALAASGCMTVGEDDLPEVDGDPDLGVAYLGCTDPGCGEQGRRLLSAVLDVGEYLSFELEGDRPDGTKVDLVVGALGGLAASDGASVADLTLTASNGGTVKIVAEVTPLAGEPGPQYQLLYTPPGGGETDAVDPCAHHAAIAIAGDFDATGHHVEATVRPPASGKRFSLACKDEGTAYKCINFGYPPGSNPDRPAWRAFQVCTRALRNDLCKDGRPHTLDQTYVQIADTFDNLGFDEPQGPYTGPSQWPPPPNLFAFESVWPEDENEPPVCLNKARWQALTPGALDSCTVRPPDPRTDPMASFCEDLGHDALRDDSIVFRSKYTDILLEEWEHTSGDLTVTVTGYYPGPSSPPRLPPVMPFGAPSGFGHVQTLGTLLRSLPGSIKRDDVINVYTYSNGATDRVLGGPTTTSWPPQGYVPNPIKEGMVFEEPPDFPPTAPLYRYQDPVTNEYYNGIDPNGPNAVLLGYILVPAEE
jgi:hypothetical protein